MDALKKAPSVDSKPDNKDSKPETKPEEQAAAMEPKEWSQLLFSKLNKNPAAILLSQLFAND